MRTILIDSVLLRTEPLGCSLVYFVFILEYNDDILLVTDETSIDTEMPK